MPLWALNTIKNLCSPKKWAKVHLNLMLLSKTSHHAKFHRDRSNQHGESVTKIGPRTKNYFVTDGQKRDYSSRASQRARGATKNSSTRAAVLIQYRRVTDIHIDGQTDRQTKANIVVVKLTNICCPCIIDSVFFSIAIMPTNVFIMLYHLFSLQWKSALR